MHSLPSAVVQSASAIGQVRDERKEYLTMEIFSQSRSQSRRSAVDRADGEGNVDNCSLWPRGGRHFPSLAGSPPMAAWMSMTWSPRMETACTIGCSFSFKGLQPTRS